MNENLYPSVSTIGFVCNGAGCGTPIVGAILTQSFASAYDYVFATNFPTTALPINKLLSSNINPPTTNPGLFGISGTGSLTQQIQYQAFQIGQGNIYAGGIFLMGIVLLVISLTLGGLAVKFKNYGIFGFIWNVSGLGIIFFFFYCGVIPLLYPVLMVIVAAAMMFGIIRSGPAHGGMVPD